MSVIAQYGVALVQQIEEIYPLSARVREAFLTTPRHAFLEPGGGCEREQWLREVYQDTAILTKQDERGRPLSSSSQPSVMAWMLEALAVQPGMRVLEIGTGTGYNAALLTRLASDPAQVVTIEIDPALATLARLRIEDVVGPGVTVVTGDGRLGTPEHGPYDRIIATASAFPVPSPWIAQLAPAGRLVLDLRGNIGGGLIVITKQADGSATGHFLVVKETVSFMGVRATAEEGARVERFELPLLQEQKLYTPETAEYACACHFCSYEQFRGKDDAFNLWIQCLFPSLSIKWIRREGRVCARMVESESHTTVVIEQRGERMGVAVKGTRPLWEEIVQAYQKWLHLGRLGLNALTLVITSEGQIMQIEHGGKKTTLAIH